MKKLLEHQRCCSSETRVEVILLSRNSADTGLRIFNTIQHHGSNITRAAFCGGERPYRYVQAFRCHLFLSTDSDDVRMRWSRASPRRRCLPSRSPGNPSEELRFAFDGDAVLFSDEAEQVFQSDGLDAFTRNEQAAARRRWPAVRSRTSSPRCIGCSTSSSAGHARSALRW